MPQFCSREKDCMVGNKKRNAGEKPGKDLAVVRASRLSERGPAVTANEPSSRTRLWGLSSRNCSSYPRWCPRRGIRAALNAHLCLVSHRRAGFNDVPYFQEPLNRNR